MTVAAAPTASPGRRLRDLMAEPRILVMPGVHDGLSYPRPLSCAALRGMRNARAVFMQPLAAGGVIERPGLQSCAEELNALMGHARCVTAAEAPSRAAA